MRSPVCRVLVSLLCLLLGAASLWYLFLLLPPHTTLSIREGFTVTVGNDVNIAILSVALFAIGVVTAGLIRVVWLYPYQKPR